MSVINNKDPNFEKLYNTYYMKVYSFVMTMAKNPTDAEEITQKAFFKAMTASRKHRGDASEFSWLCAIAKNLFIDEFRENKRSAQIDANAASDTNVENIVVDKDSAFHIHQALYSLEEPYKEVFELRVFGELAFRQIGANFGKTENWARVTYHRARLKIQERVKLT